MADDYKIEKSTKNLLSTGVKTLLGAGLIAGVGVIAYPMLVSKNLPSTVETSVIEEFQEGEPTGGFGRIQGADTEPTAQSFDIGPLTAEIEGNRAELEERNEKLAAQVKALQARLGSLADEADKEQNAMAAQLAKALSTAQKQNAEALLTLQKTFKNELDQRALEVAEAAQARDEQIAALVRQNEALQTQITAGAGNGDALEMERMRFEAELERARLDSLARQNGEQQRIEQKRRQELEERRAAAAQALKERVESKSVIFDAGGNVNDKEGSEAPKQQAALTGDAAGRDFVTSGDPVEVTMAEVVANPSRTVLQGTMIEATLENAVDSSLPGTISAVVNFPVYSFDGSAVLMPQGTRLFGRYSSDVGLGQNRLLVSWTRAVTPQGQSVQMASYGGDAQGRSGITGNVNSRFGARFGSAALISLISVAPTIAAAQSNDETVSEAYESVGDDLSNATSSIMGEYLRLPPIISLNLGATVTVMVDRDLEFY